jgi:hypothetical protein
VEGSKTEDKLKVVVEATPESRVVESSMDTNSVLGSIGLGCLCSGGGSQGRVLCGVQVSACISQLIRHEGQALLGGSQHTAL